ncbi:MAG: CocE/NonD family hydrolase [Bacteroidota bacterium]
MGHFKFFLLGLLFFLPEMTPLAAQAPETYPQLHYDKTVYSIEMRDGIKLYTVVYSPKDQSKTYPILIKRTPYGCRPYEAAAYPKELGPSHYLQEDGYIFVYQDVRGRWMSEGEYTNMTPHIPNKTSNNQVDESTDTYDTIDWLINNVRNHNGKVGQWGISYPGFYTTAGAIDAHPAMKASSPQAPIADFYFDDFHHRGAYFLSYFAATEVFGHQTEPTTQTWYDRLEPGTKDAYRFFLEMGSLANGDQYLPNNFFWEELGPELLIWEELGRGGVLR